MAEMIFVITSKTIRSMREGDGVIESAGGWATLPPTSFGHLPLAFARVHVPQIKKHLPTGCYARGSQAAGFFCPDTVPVAGCDLVNA